MCEPGFFKVVGNRNRRCILERLAERPYYMSELAEEIGIGQKAVIDHLEVLETNGMVESNRGKHNRRYVTISKTLHAEVLISPDRVRAVVRELDAEEDRGELRRRGALDRMESLIRSLSDEGQKRVLLKELKKLNETRR